jgi:hypothetical protein
MQRVLDPRCGEYHAITDVYCGRRNTFLVKYPTWLIVGVVLVGIVAIMVVGFLGYGYEDSAGTGLVIAKDGVSFLAQPWPLYLWLVGVLVVIQISILRNVRLRGPLIGMLIITAICTALVGLGYTPYLQSILRNLFGGEFIRRLGTYPQTWTILNFALIIIFLFDTARRWLGRALGRPEVGDFAGRENDPDAPTTEELASGDLLAGTILFLLMALFFTATTVGALANFAHIYNDSSACFTAQGTLAGCNNITPDTFKIPAGWPFAGTDLSQIDQILGLICLPVAFLVLAVSAMLNGLGALGAVNANDPRLQTTRAEGATENVSAQVSLTIVNSLRAALDRRIRILANRIIASLRNLFWPIMVFFAVFSLNLLARYFQIYLHNPKGTANSINTLAFAGGWAIVAIFMGIGAVALLLFDGEVAVNALRFMGWLGFLLLLTFWLFAIALEGFNLALNVTNVIPKGAPARDAFKLSVSTAVSLAFLLGYGIYFFVRTVRGRTGKLGTAAPGASATRETVMAPGDAPTAPLARPPEG